MIGPSALPGPVSQKNHETAYQVDPDRYDEVKTDPQIETDRSELEARYAREFAYYGTDAEIERDGYRIRGLDLPREILEQFFYENAARWIPGIERGF